MTRLACLVGVVLFCSVSAPVEAQGACGFVVGPGFVAGGFRAPVYPSYVVVPPAPCVVQTQYIAPVPVVTHYHYAAPAYGVVGYRPAFVGGSVGVVRGVGPYGGRGVAVFRR